MHGGGDGLISHFQSLERLEFLDGGVDARDDGSSCTLPTRSSSGNAYLFLEIRPP